MRLRVRVRRAAARCAVGVGSLVVVVSVTASVTACGGAPDPSGAHDALAAVDLAIGGETVCTVERDRSVVCGDADRRSAVEGVADAVAVVAGHDHACARLSSGRVACWGGNHHGQLGDGTVTERVVAAPVRGLERVTAISAGHARTCAVVEDGSAWCWGARELDPHRMLVEPRIAPTPTRIDGLKGVAAIAVGGFHMCALSDAGTVACWGSNELGQLGDGTRTSREAPRTIVGLDRVVAVGAGWLHTCALRDDGEVLCWGADLVGQQGPHDTPGLAKTSPSRIEGLPRAREVVVAGEHTCAIPRDGSAPRCWGHDGEGQITGRPSGIVRTPKRLGIGAVSRLAAGAARTCAILTDGALRCWGARADDHGPT